MKLSNFGPRFYVAATLIAIVLFIGLIGPFLVHTDPNATVGGLYDRPAGWGPLLLGTDNEGQSVIANLVHGTRTSLIVGLLAGTIATVIGLIVGIVAGFRGGLVDNLLSALTNIFLVIPVIIVVVLLSVALDNRSIFTLAFVMGITSWPWLARAVRAQTTSVRTREHIDVALLSGASFWSILLRDVLPYLLSYVVMAFVLQVSGAILLESTLSMLGLGPSNAVSLGIMLYWAIAWGLGPHRCLVGLRATDPDADHDLVLAAAAAVQPRRDLQPAAAARQVQEATAGRPEASGPGC